MNYYQSLLNDIDILIKSKDYIKAKKLIDDELSMAYIPQDVNKQLHDYLDMLPIDSHVQSVGIVEIENWLFGNDYLLSIEAINYLNDLNLNNFLDKISEWLLRLKDRYLIGLIIMILMKQNIDFTFKLERDDLEIEFNPFYLEFPHESDAYSLISQKLIDICGHDTNLLKVALDNLVLEVVMLLPFNIDIAEVDLYLNALIFEVYRLFDKQDEYQLLLDKNLISRSMITLFSTQ